MKFFKKTILILLVIFAIAQFFGPEQNQGDLASVESFYSDTNPPEQVKMILKENCNDCHSDVTRYPWYSYITPVNYWMAAHVEDGKKHFNVSDWDLNSTKRKDHKFEELIEMVENKDMPLASYTWGHPEAKLSDEQINSVIDWAKKVRFKYSLEAKPE